MKKVGILLVALVAAYGGVLLALYAEADDAPGAVLIGGVIVLGALAVGARALVGRRV